MTDTNTAGRGWAYTGIILGGLVSVAANVAHSFIAPTGAAAGWTPEPGAVISAIVWPVFLFIAVEILARITWPHGAWWSLLRYAGMLPVAAVAAFVSYRHLSGLLAHYGEEAIVYRLGPLAVDGLMVMATGALLATSARTHRTPTNPTAAAPSAAPSTNAATPPATPPDTPTGKAPVKRAPAKKASPAKAATATPRPAPRTPIPSPVSTVATTISESATSPATPARTVPTAPAQATAPPTADIPVAPVGAAQPLTRPVPAAILTRAMHLAEAHRAATATPITANELAVRLRVNTDIANQLIALLDLAPNSPTTPITHLNGTPVGANK